MFVLEVSSTMMLVFCCLALYICKVLVNSSNISIYDKFHQNDYKLKFERLELVSYNKVFMKRFEIVTYKHNRTCAAVNLTIEVNIDVDNQLEMIVQTYKFMSNEYRYFPLRIQLNLCFAISKDIVGMGKSIGYCGNFSGCPFLKNKMVHICKWTPDESKFPPLIPNGNYMQEYQLIYKNKEVAVFRSYAEIFRPIAY